MRVIARESHLGLEVPAIVHGLLVHNDQGDTPLEDVFVDEL
jgi:hypothetical protein